MTSKAINLPTNKVTKQTNKCLLQKKRIFIYKILDKECKLFETKLRIYFEKIQRN